MAITKQNKESLVEASVGGKVVGDVKKSLNDEAQNSSQPSVDPSSKKTGFFRSTVQELRKVQWPAFRYVVNWSVVIILFTAFFSIGLGFFDSIFQGGISFVDCIAPNSRNQTISSCGQEFGDKIANFPR